MVCNYFVYLCVWFWKPIFPLTCRLSAGSHQDVPLPGTFLGTQRLFQHYLLNGQIIARPTSVSSNPSPPLGTEQWLRGEGCGPQVPQCNVHRHFLHGPCASWSPRSPMCWSVGARQGLCHCSEAPTPTYRCPPEVLSERDPHLGKAPVQQQSVIFLSLVVV